MQEKQSIGERLDAVIVDVRDGRLTFGEAVKEFRKRYIEHVLRTHYGNQVKAARELQMHRNSLRRLITELGIDLDSTRKPRHRSVVRKPVMNAPLRAAVRVKELA